MRTILSHCLPPHDKLELTGEILRPIAGYTTGQSATFARLFWHERNAKQQIGVIFSGDDLRMAILLGLPHEEMIAYIAANGFRVTRLDFAIDVYDPDADPLELLRAWRSGNLTSGARQVANYTSSKFDADAKLHDAGTVYFGSRSSDRQLRVYDKASQMGKSGNWTRIELVVRHERANALLSAMISHGIRYAGQAAIRDYVNYDRAHWWNRATQGIAVPIQPVGRKITATEKWLRDVVLPVLDRTLEERISAGDWMLYDLYDRAILAALARSHVKSD